MPASVLRVLDKTQEGKSSYYSPTLQMKKLRCVEEYSSLPIPGTYSKKEHRSSMCGYGTHTFDPGVFWPVRVGERPCLSVYGTSPLQHGRRGAEPVPGLRALR